jgi:hypothetical protein
MGGRVSVPRAPVPLWQSEEVHRVDEGNLELVPLTGIATVRIFNRQ